MSGAQAQARPALRSPVIAAVALAALVAAGCLTTSDVLVGRGWKLEQVGGVPAVDPAGVIGVAFGTDGRFSVHTGCQSGGGTYHLDGNRIVLDSEELQPVPCDEATARQEAAMLGVVEGRPRYEIDTRTGNLRLTTEAGDTLVFSTP